MPRKLAASAPRRYVALLRGINVGRAKRVAMADLRALLAELGYRDPRSLLNSGNLVFSSPQTDTAEMADRQPVHCSVILLAFL